MLKNTRWEPLLWWAYAAIAVSGMCGLVSLSVQQNFRQNANDPQIQMAEDAAVALSSGTSMSKVLPSGEVDIHSSLSPWLAVYDAQGRVLGASGELNNALPQIPLGVFDISQWNNLIIGHHLNSSPPDENRFTWQPEADVRQAVVLVQFTSSNAVGFVAAGRSLREVEVREQDLQVEVLAAWVFTLGCLLVASYVAWWLLRY